MKAVTASNTISMEELPTNTKAVRNEKEAVTTPTTKKRVTTIFVMRKQAKYKVPMAKKPAKKVQEVPKQEETNSSDEELIAAAQALEDNQEVGRNDKEGEAPSVAGKNVMVDMPPYLPDSDSDEELLLATLELEHLQLANLAQEDTAEEAHHQGGGHHGDQHHQEGVRQVPDLKPSLEMTESHLKRTQGWKGEQLCQAAHSPGGHQGGAHHHEQDEGEGGDHQQQEEGAVGGTPPSPTLTSSPRTPPNTRMPQEHSSSPSSSRRVICTPLWKRKAKARLSSSSSSAAKKEKRKRRSQLSTPVSTPTSVYMSTIKSSRSPSQLRELSDPREVRPGSISPKIKTVTNYHISPQLICQESQAKTSNEPTEMAGDSDQSEVRSKRKERE
jgi:hypothetical protein